MKLNNTDRLLRQMYSEKRFGSYGVLVSKDGEKRLLSSEDVNGDTYFDNASTGKVLVTSTLILKAIDEGKLKLTDTLSSFFDNVPTEKKEITVFQLLTHTSGIVRYLIPARDADCGRESVASFIIAQPLAFAPGSSYIYSCNGYILLGYILEKLYGKSLDELYKEKTVASLGLTRSRFNIPFDEPNQVVCYRWRERGKRLADDENAYALGGVAGNGASFSTLNDVERFIIAVLNRDKALYSRELFDLAEKDYTPDFAVGRGLGYLITDERYDQTGNLFPNGSFGHCGHCGHSFFINRELNMYVVILTNATRYANMNNNFWGYDYGEVCKMRKLIHNAIKSDLF